MNGSRRVVDGLAKILKFSEIVIPGASSECEIISDAKMADAIAQTVQREATFHSVFCVMRANQDAICQAP
jgi:hypothetical protein